MLERERIKQTSTLKLKQLLLDTIEGNYIHWGGAEPSIYLTSQKSLSSYVNPEFEIIQTTINSLKRSADLYLKGGYSYLDKLRKAAQKKVNTTPNQKRPRKQSKSGLEVRLKEVENLSETQREDLIVLSYALTLSLNKSWKLITESGRADLIDLCREHHHEIYQMLSPLKNIELGIDKNGKVIFPDFR